jgi:uncharacterized protein YukE
MTTDPTAGDPASIRAIAATLQRQAGEIRTAASRVQRQADAVSAGEWTGKSRAPFVHAAADVSTGGERVATQVDQVATELTTYAARVEQIQDEARTIKAAQARNQHDAVTNSRSTQKLQDSHAVDVAAQLGGLAVEAASLTASKRALNQSWDDLVARRKAADAATASKLRSSDSIGAFSVSASSISGMSDSQFLTFLAGLRPEEVAAFAGNSTIADRLAGLKDPEAVAKWWSGLGGEHGKGTAGEHSAAQDAFVAAFPAAVGNLNGVAYWARDVANRSELARQKQASDDRLADLEKAISRAVARGDRPYDLAQQIAAERVLNKQLENFASAARGSQLPGTPLWEDVPVQVLSFRAGHPPLGAISLGDLDQAPNVSYLVPGMATTTGDSTVLQRAARNIKDVQNGFTGDPAETAVVAWINYDTPVNAAVDPTEVLSDQKAEAGARELGADLEGFRASRGDKAVLNLIGHSYGTTTASITLAARSDLHVATFVSLGSAGIPDSIHDAASLHTQHVYAGTGDEAVAPAGRFFSGRTDPSSPSFGADKLATGSESHPAPTAVGTPLEPRHGVTAHDPLKHEERGDPYGYLDRSTSSVFNTGRATVAPW